MILDLMMAAAGAQGSGPVEITFVAGNHNSAGGTVVTVMIPAAAEAGDIAFAIGFNAGNPGEWSQTAGWTEIKERTTSPQNCVAYKVLDGSESSVTLTRSFAEVKTAIVGVYRAANYSAIGEYGSGSTTTIAPEIVGALAGKLLAIFGNSSTSTSVNVPTTPAGMTLDYASPGNTTNPSIILCSQDISAGATGTRTSTSNVATSTAGILVSLTPAI